MDDDNSKLYTFAQMTTLEQHNVLELCMSQNEIPWKELLAKVFVEFQNEEYLSFMIKKYKDSLDAQSTFDTPNKKPKVGFVSVSNDNRSRQGSPGSSSIGQRNL